MSSGSIVIFPVNTDAPAIAVEAFKDHSWYLQHQKEIDDTLSWCPPVANGERWVQPAGDPNTVHRYGCIKMSPQLKAVTAICTLLISKTPATHVEMYNACARDPQDARELIKYMLATLHAKTKYTYAWISIGVQHDEALFKTLAKLYASVGMTKYPTYGLTSPFGVSLAPAGAIQLVGYVGASSPSASHVTEIVNNAWTCAVTRTTALRMYVQPAIMDQLYQKYGDLDREVGGPLAFKLSTLHRNEDVIQVDVGDVSPGKLKYGPSGGLYHVEVDKAAFIFHTHPIPVILALNAMYLWPSVPDVRMSFAYSAHSNTADNANMTLASFVLSRYAYYEMTFNVYARAILLNLSLSNFTAVTDAYVKHLNTNLYEERRSIYADYFRSLGWKAANVQPVGTGQNIHLREFHFQPPNTGKVYTSIQNALDSDEYKQQLREQQVKSRKRHILDYLKTVNEKHHKHVMRDITGLTLKGLFELAGVGVIPDTFWIRMQHGTYLRQMYNSGIPVLEIQAVPYHTTTHQGSTAYAPYVYSTMPYIHIPGLTYNRHANTPFARGHGHADTPVTLTSTMHVMPSQATRGRVSRVGGRESPTMRTVDARRIANMRRLPSPYRRMSRNASPPRTTLSQRKGRMMATHRSPSPPRVQRRSTHIDAIDAMDIDDRNNNNIMEIDE